MEDELTPDLQPESPPEKPETATQPSAEPPSVAQPPSAPPPAAEFAPPAAPAAKRKVDPLFLILGFLTPMLLGSVAGTAFGLVASALYGDVGPGMGVVWCVASLPILLFVAFVVLFFVGRSKANERMRSFGLGGMLSYAVGALLSLLVWGTCIVGLGLGQ